MGASVAAQVLRRLVERNTGAAFPTVTNQALRSPSTAIHVPLAAKAPSEARERGADDDGSGVQFAPPSLVRMTSNCPSTGSPSAIPWSWSQNAMQSKKPLGS